MSKLQAQVDVSKRHAKHEERKRYAVEGKLEHIKRVVEKHACLNGMEKWQSCGDTLCLPCSIRRILRDK